VIGALNSGVSQARAATSMPCKPTRIVLMGRLKGLLVGSRIGAQS